MAIDSKKLLHDPEFTATVLERLGQSAPLVVSPQGAILYASQRVLRLLKLTARAAEGKHFLVAVKLCNEQGEALPERKNPVCQALQKGVRTQMTPFFCYLQRKGEKPPIPVAVKAWQIRSGRTLRCVVVEIREIERVLNVGEMKSLFVSFAAHQLKTPSSIVKGFLELMLREGAKAYQPQQWYNLQSAFEANENLINLSKTLLNLTRLEGGLIEPRIVPFNPAVVLKSKISGRKPLLAGHNIKVKLETKGSRGMFPSDETFFSEIYDILFSNALKYSPTGSIITVTLTVNKDELRLEVADQGPGLPLEQQKTLFDTGFSPDEANNSHGLGLFMAKKYVSLLKGKIGLIPNQKHGAKFFFTIPKPII